jgi:outer membrane beta-barrel protein
VERLRTPRWYPALTLPLALALVLGPARARAQIDEEEEEETGKKATPTTPAPPPKPAEVAPGTPAAPAKDSAQPAAAARPAPSAAQSAGADLGYLEGRAGSTSPNERISTVEKMGYSAAGKSDATLYPVAFQLNSKFTQTFGVAVAYNYAIQENFALQLNFGYNYFAGNTAFGNSLIEHKVRAQGADALFLRGGATAGFEVAPVYGKFAFYEGNLVQFRFIVNAGAGAGKTEVQLTPTSPIVYGDAGYRFLGNLGLGFRVLLNERVALRLEVRDLIYTARIDHINGCRLPDLNDITNQTCDNPAHFGNSTTAKNQAGSLLGDNSSAVLNNLLLFGGVSYLF